MVEKEQSMVSFVEEVEDSLVNAIRRYINEISLLAVDEVEVFKNDSALYDETLAHRIGLVPLKFDKAIGEKGAKLKLSVNKEGTVYSGELKGNLKPVFDKIPLAILNKDQEMELVAETKLGKGSEHAKFSPGLMFYRNILQIKTGSKGKEVQEAVINSKNNDGREMKFENNKSYELDVGDALESELSSLGIEMIPTDKQKIVIESFGQLPVGDLIPSAIKQLKSDLAAVDKEISKSK